MPPLTFTAFQTPPPGFFSIEGIYQHRFDPCVVETFNQISNVVTSNSMNLLPDPFNNPTNNPPVKFLSYQQYTKYKNQLDLFRRVYKYNLCQWQNQTISEPAQPYLFATSEEFYTFNESVGLVNKLYNVNPQYNLSNMFIMPFPPFAASFPPPT